MLAVLAGLATSEVSGAQIIDRMLAVVDGQVVTQSDIEEYRVLARGFGEELSDDDGVVLDQIIEDLLISRQIAQFPGNALGEAQLDAYVAGFMDSGGQLGGERLRRLARRRLELERYYASLRRSLRPLEEEIQELYDNEFVPAFRAANPGVAPPDPSAVRAELEEIVIAGKLVREIDLRVELLHRRYRVEVVE